MQTARSAVSVSYTHLDVYKRQDDGPGDDADGNTLGDAVSGGHSQNGQEGGDALTGIIDCLLYTSLTRDWYVDVDVSKYAAYFVVALNHDMSVSSIIDPLKKIESLLANRK